jgi:hypothetical protein
MLDSHTTTTTQNSPRLFVRRLQPLQTASEQPKRIRCRPRRPFRCTRRTCSRSRRAPRIQPRVGQCRTTRMQMRISTGAQGSLGAQ